MCGFGIQLNGFYLSHSVILILEAPKATWMTLDELDGCSLVRDLNGPNFSNVYNSCALKKKMDSEKFHQVFL